MNTLTMHKKSRTFVPEDLEITWPHIQPYLDELEIRPLHSIEELKQWLRDRSELESVLEEDYAWRYIRMTCDTTNEAHVKAFEYYATEIEPKIAPYGDRLNRKFIESAFTKELDETYAIYIRNIETQIRIFREKNIPLLTELQVEQQRYGAIAGAMTVTIGEKEYTLEQASNFLKDVNRDIRQEAFEKIAKRRLQDKKTLDELFNKLLKLRHQVALNAGFSNFRDYMFAALGRFDYTPADCEAFHEAIASEIVPITREFAEKRRSTLGLDVLRPWDMDVDISGKPALVPFQSAQELIDKTISCFYRLHPYMGERLEVMKDNNLFDLESRKGKAPGGYNYPLAESGAPFIFMNAANAFRDLTTMVHEGGHAVHTFISADLELNGFKHVPSEVAELASMSMEMFTMDHWDIYFSDTDDLKRSKREQLTDVLKVLPWVAIVDKFQHWIYLNPEHTTEQRTEMWAAIFREFGAGFSDWTEYEDVMQNIWQKQLHIFEVPFYYIEYGIAQLGAIALWKNYKKDPGKTIEQYLDALKLGYTTSIRKIYASAGIEFNFTAAYVKELATFIKKELEKLNSEA